LLRATGWTAGLRFPLRVSDFSLIRRFQTGSEAHLASSPMGIGAISPGLRGRSVNLTIPLHLVPRTRIVELYFHSPIHLRGAVLNPLIN
jgi:hypothetical protein